MKNVSWDKSYGNNYGHVETCSLTHEDMINTLNYTNIGFYIGKYKDVDHLYQVSTQSPLAFILNTDKDFM